MSENEDAPVNTIVLTLTKDPWSLNIGGQVENVDLALSMLEQAKREFDLRWRVAAAASQMEDAKKKAEEFSRVRNILDRGAIRQ